MKTMKLHELINIFENEHEVSVNYDSVAPYKKLLYAYLKRFYCCEPILMVTDITNTSCHCRIVPESDFLEAVYAYMDVDFIDELSDDFSQYEDICANSVFLKDMI